MIFYLLIIEKDKDTESSQFYTKISSLKKAIDKAKTFSKCLDICVYEGTRDDKMANYRMTLDPYTLQDKGF